ncbi:sterol 24-C-methyltransferase / SMT2 [Leishmania donovani]|uniref:Methyltransferase n=3 Tax=Leishmania donovani species complex TaxID=38574 RepID=A0A6L0Y1X7_LEIIN|nr:putative sterol 24-c-methyltransferase [Leishmania infantum JPCM5]CAC9550372.1 sterol_24-c-methyltransferase_-_putative [Leishmania infantum]CAJ1993615.1 sterol 24-C-methyltransferase / SMT2 [Leishmania donovani]CAM72944.1 putative sterol 24-c-methyltransferase [Leishmania infantum JPCM5]SUZ46627.1 sterol_24-c-methyltransferase_-_putative [Leishmania infantum]VDZ49441.1 sterol_24-c-methyltransferase_putative/GeneDB:LmjF.36.2380/GeneDB:LmjF.36.2390 [Leishmania donovani]|eukprot:XP_001469832.1 putative sterol 24-c-methyltransferase [Leishmania infantum JPCM5]
MSAGGRETAPTNLIRRRNKDETNGDVSAAADRFRDRFEKATLEERKAATTTMVNEYYDLVTDFYEYGWGQNFHFAPRYAGETFFESLARHEYFLAARGGFMEGDHIVDVGCGVGGPARNMVRLTRCNVIGVNNNDYQISRARRHDALAGMSSKIDYVKTDFCNMSLADNTFDGAYAIEATCHAKDKVKCYSEVFRVIKPGTCFVLYEWCMTDKYNPNDEYHRTIKHRIELGDGLPEMETCKQVIEYMKQAGFVVEEAIDVISQFESSPIKSIPWYQPLVGDYSSLQGLRSTPIGRILTNVMCRVLEFVRLAPKGTYKATEILEEAAESLVVGGQLGIFTPSFYIRARKPSKQA